MWYIGVDTHKNRCVLVAKKVDGTKMMQKSFVNSMEGWQDAFLNVPAKSLVAFEAIGWYEKTANILREMGMQPVLANARRVDSIAKSKKKTDRHDANMLSDLLRAEFLPKCYIPSPKGARLRELGNALDAVVKQQTKCKNGIHAILANTWLKLPDVTDLFGRQGRTWLKSIKIEPSRKLLIHQALGQLDFLAKHAEEIQNTMAAITRDDEEVRLALSIHGVGHATAYIMHGHIDDVTRFPNRRTIRANFGNIPSVRDSDETHHRGRITKQGSSLVRKHATQAGFHLARKDPNAKKKRERLISEKKGAKAIVASATDVIDVIYQVLKTKTPYRQVNPELWNQKLRQHEQMAQRGQAILNNLA